MLHLLFLSGNVDLLTTTFIRRRLSLAKPLSEIDVLRFTTCYVVIVFKIFLPDCSATAGRIFTKFSPSPDVCPVLFVNGGTP